MDNFVTPLPCFGKNIGIAGEMKTKVFHGAFFSEMVTWASDDSGYYHIDPDGNPLYEERFEKTEAFHEGLAGVVVNGQAFHITKNGLPAYGRRFDKVGFFHNGTAKAELGGEEFCINHQGERVA